MIFSQQRGEWENIGGQSEDTMVEVKGQVGLGLRVWGCNRRVKLSLFSKKKPLAFFPEKMRVVISLVSPRYSQHILGLWNKKYRESKK